MLRSIKTLCVGGLVAMTMGSCWELEQEVLTGLTQEQLNENVTPELIEVLKQSAYGAVVAAGYGSHGGLYSINEVSSDQLAIPQKGADWEDGGIWLRTHRHTWLTVDGPYNGSWQQAFRIVAECNLLLSQYPDLEDLGAELRVLRAFGYLLLIDNFGNVPIIRETDRGAPAQNTREQVFEFIEQSILENVDNLTRTNTRTNLNYWSAHMILAKLYLNAEVYTGTARWADAERIIDVIINEGPYSLAPNFFSNFAASNSNSPENMFTIPYDANNAEGFNIHQMTFHYSTQQTFELQEQPWNGYAALEEFYNSFEDGDVRKGSLREGLQFASDGVTPLIDDAVEATDPDGPEINFTPFINQLAPNAWRQAGTRINKFEIPLGSAPSLNNDFPIYRYADVLLMKAEVAWRQGNNAVALQFVNQLRDRANVAPLTSVDADVLLAERGRELFAEGHRRSDLIRFGRFNAPWWEKAASQPFRNLFPIPQNQLQANPNLRQNPGY